MNYLEVDFEFNSIFFRIRKKIELNSKSTSRINASIIALDKPIEINNLAEGSSDEISPLVTTGPPGITGFASGRPKVQEVISFWPALIDKKLIKTKVKIL